MRVGTLTCGSNGAVSAPSNVRVMPCKTCVGVLAHSFSTHSICAGFLPLIIFCSIKMRPQPFEPPAERALPTLPCCPERAWVPAGRIVVGELQIVRLFNRSGQR